MNKRRIFIKRSGLFLAATALPFPNFLINGKQKKLGVALVGLGNYSTNQLAPALQQTQYCELKGIVTGSPEKIPQWQEKYNIKDQNVYNYENMHEVANNSEIDVIYIVLPNSMHAKYSIIAANAGKHVWCEKPMATTAKECREMIDACEKNNVKLSIGYRMQHEKNTRQIMEWAKTKPFGEITAVEARAGFNGPVPQWKKEKSMGGGAMFDMGVYPLNATRYSTNMEPVAVSATHPEMINNVDETTTFTLRFPNDLTADCKTSFAESMNRLEVTCEEGKYYLEPFQSYSGVKGRASDGTILEPFGKNQQAVQMDDDALAILEDKPVMVPGEDGMKDIIVVEKIFESADNNGEWLEIERI